MKKFFHTLVLSILSISVLAQAPQMFNYQAVLRNNAGEPIASNAVTVNIEILQGSATGSVVFTETHSTETNEFGLINLQIGSVQSLDAVDWTADDYFIKVSVDETSMGSTQLLSVPYALHAGSAEETDPLFASSVASDITQENVESWDAKSEFDGEFSSLTGVPNSVIMPAGVINIFAGSIAPDGYLICDGREVSRTEYADLFAVIGTAYGEGDGSTTFNLPDLQSRIPVGISTEPEFDELGKTGGAKDHALTVDEMPVHSHDGSTGEAGGHDHEGNTSSSGGHSHTGSTSTSGAHSHSGTTNTTGAHTHAYSRRARTLKSAGGLPNFYEAGGLTTVNTSTSGNHSHSFTTSTAGGHTHTLSIASVANHSHIIAADGSHEHTVSIGESGGGISHNNLQPYIVLNFIIKY